MPVSSVRFAVLLSLELVPSRIFGFGSIVCHVLALASITVSALPVPITALSAVLIIGSWVWISLRYGSSRSPWFVRKLRRTEDGQWLLGMGDGSEQAARLVSSYVHPSLTVLHFATGRLACRSVVVLADSADPEAIRRLRVHLVTLAEDGD